MPGLPAVANLTYNGYTFDGTQKVKCKRTNVRDEADRTTIYVKIELTVEATIATGDGSSTDGALNTIKGLLTCDGGALTYTNGGFGTELIVNQGAVKDVTFGPKPQMIEWSPAGSHGACEIVWTVTTCIPPCGTSGRSAGVIALNYEASYDIDELGDTTRTISGYYEIAMTRINNQQPCTSRNLPDSADKYRNVVVRNPPDGFTRKTTWKLSKDKRRMDFVVVDRQIPTPNPWPIGVTAINGKHSVRISRGTFARAKNVISMTITPNRGITGAQAWMLFLNFVKQRKAAAENSGHYVLFTDLSLEEDIFGRPANFRLEYIVYGYKGPGNPFNDIVKEMGLWNPTGDQWGPWRNSLANSTFNARGNAGLIDDPTNDVILDSCSGASPGPSSPSNLDGPRNIYPGGTLASTPPNPSGANSYVNVQCYLSIQNDSPTAGHEALQADGSQGSVINPEAADPQNVPPPTNQQQSESPVGTSTGDAEFKAPAGITPQLFIVQRRGVYRYFIVITGAATRIGFPVPRVGLGPNATVGDAKAYELGDSQFHTWPAGTALGYGPNNIGGLTIYKAAFRLHYQLDKAPGKIKPLSLVIEGQQ